VIYVNWRQKVCCNAFTVAHCPHQRIAPIETRKNVQNRSKQTVAAKAVKLIQPGQVVMIDGGTTAHELVARIPQDIAFTVVTHSPGIAVCLVDHPWLR
jgi:transcriptional regulator, DeoR family